MTIPYKIKAKKAQPIPKNNLNILALDLSISSTGYTVISKGEIIECNRIVTDKANKASERVREGYKHFFVSLNEDERIYYIASIIDELTKKYNITDFCIEDQYIGCNPKTGLTLSKLKGSVIYIGMNNNINIHHMKPTEVRMHLMGIGSADKLAVANFIRNNYYDVGEFVDKKSKKKTDDMYDSIGCGVALLNKLYE